MAKNTNTNSSKFNSTSDPTIHRLGQNVVKRHRNLFVYMIFGFIAALINTVVFMVIHKYMHSPVLISNTIAFVISNLASFVFNQKAVFTNNVDEEHSTWQKLIVFFTYRIISLIPDSLIMLVGLSWLKLNALFVKILDQVLVGIFNYLTTRSVFQAKETTMIERAKKMLKQHQEKHQK